MSLKVLWLFPVWAFISQLLLGSLCSPSSDPRLVPPLAHRLSFVFSLPIAPAMFCPPVFPICNNLNHISRNQWRQMSVDMHLQLRICQQCTNDTSSSVLTLHTLSDTCRRMCMDDLYMTDVRVVRKHPAVCRLFSLSSTHRNSILMSIVSILQPFLPQIF